MFSLLTRYIDGEVSISFGNYANGDIAMELYSDEGPEAKATVCIPGVNAAKGNVIIKDWSENEGMLHGLQAAGIIGPVVKEHVAGFAIASECELLIPPF